MATFSLELVPKDPFWKLDMMAHFAEEMGLDGVWLSEHPHNRGSFLTASQLLKRTRRLWIGVGVVNPYTVNPAVIAQKAATLTELAPNRFRLAIGAGDLMALEALGLKREKPLKTVAEAVRLVKALLKRRVYGGMRLDFRPRSRVPVYVGAQGPRMLRLGGRLGDGVLVNHSQRGELRWAFHRVLEGAREAGRSPRELDLAAYLTVSISRDREKAVKAAAPYAAYILCGAGRRLLEELDVKPGLIDEVKDAVRRRDWLKLYSVLPSELVERLTVSGEPRLLREVVEEALEIGYTQIVFGAPLGPRVLQSLREIGNLINRLR